MTPSAPSDELSAEFEDAAEDMFGSDLPGHLPWAPNDKGGQASSFTGKDASRTLVPRSAVDPSPSSSPPSTG